MVNPEAATLPVLLVIIGFITHYCSSIYQDAVSAILRSMNQG